MNAKQLVKKFKIQEYQEYEDEGSNKVPSAKILREDLGIRIRQPKAIVEKFGPNVFDVATTYFYSNQQGTTGLVKRLIEFANNNDFTVTPLDHWSGKEITDFSPDSLSYTMNNWPKDSWASILVRID